MIWDCQTLRKRKVERKNPAHTCRAKTTNCSIDFISKSIKRNSFYIMLQSTPNNEKLAILNLCETAWQQNI